MYSFANKIPLFDLLFMRSSMQIRREFPEKKINNSVLWRDRTMIRFLGNDLSGLCSEIKKREEMEKRRQERLKAAT